MMKLGSPESLPSEDWISQPPSSASASETKDSSVLQHSDSASQSRIPRLNSRSVSNPSLPSRIGPRSPTSPLERRHGHILSERTASDINISHKGRLSSAGKNNGQQLGSLRLRLGKRQGSTNSIGPAPLGTVQHRDRSAPSQAESGATPDWKKRVLARGGTSGKQPDLFSPIGLESVFKAPSSRQEPRKQVRKPQHNSSNPAFEEIYPSSPPPYPLALPQPSREPPQHSVQSPKRTFKSPTIEPGSRRPSKLATSRLQPVKSRIESGESVSRNEEISLVQVSNGMIHHRYEPLPSSALLFLSQDTESQSVNKRAHPSSSESENRNTNSFASANRQANISSIHHTNRSPPDDLSINTEAYISNGGFVNVLRGSNSADDSFQRRPLSPSSFHPSEIIVQDSDPPLRRMLQGVTERGSLSTTPSQNHNSCRSVLRIGPVTPTRISAKEHDMPDPPKSSGSPLKLFDKYDTFTNERLIRRMSQFAETLPESPIYGVIDEGRQQSQSPQKPQHDVEQVSKLLSAITERRISNFGEGTFDNFDFTHRQLAVLDQTSLEDSSKNQENFPPLPQLHQRRHRLDHRRMSSVKSRAADSSRGLSNTQRPEIKKYEDDLRDSEALTYQLWNKEGKRSPASPIRDPSPKRRRTITRSLNNSPMEKADDDIGPESGLRAITGRKRMDARYEQSSQTADPAVLASRPMLRPRTLAPNQTLTTCQKMPTELRSGQVDEPDHIELEFTTNRSNDNALSIVDAPVQALAGELANFAFDVAQDITYGDRKASVTTADFTSAANLIMQNIRAQTRPRSERASGEGTEMEQLAGIKESQNEGSTVEEFSRPPSRERGGTLRRLRDQTPLDPRVISHLRKFEENNETEITLSSSLKPWNIIEDLPTQQPSDIESDPPNVRIFSKRRTVLSDDHETNTIASLEQHQIRSQHSQPSSSQSTTRSVPTGSSSGSGNKATIAPDKVSHLLSDYVAGMTFDRARQVWVRKRSAENTRDDNTERIGSDLTEDDPLKQIPDLSVDELEELNRMNLAARNSRPTSNNTTVNLDTAKAQLQSCGSSSEKCHYLNHLSNDACSTPNNPAQFENSRTASKASQGQAYPITLQVSTQQDDMHLEHTSTPSQVQQDEDGHGSEEVEREISILEGRSTPRRSNQRHRQPRVVTVAFSSPLVDPLRESQLGTHGFEGEIWEDNSDLNLESSPEHWQSVKRRTTSRKPSKGYSAHGTSRSRHKVSISGRNFTTRPVSRIDERDEVFLVENTGCIRNNSMDLILSTPQPLTYETGRKSVLPTRNAINSDVTFHLSPLSDFTIHQRDNYSNSDIGHVEKSRGLLSLHEVEGRYSLAIKELVEKITDIEPYEPYWECIRKLSLKDKKLDTLYMLDDFCARIEELDVSDNVLEQLDGAPSSIRTLDIRHNCVSNLTAWGHLCNLQYLDVSRNQLQNLNGLGGLVHLRELVADDNQISSLDGLAHLNGMIKLRVKRNALKYLDFHNFDMRRLVEIDAESNCLEGVRNVYELPSIAHLNLRDNNLMHLPGGGAQPVESLRYLDISTNNIQDIDVKYFPNLRTLHLDRNRVMHIDGLEHCASLSTVSWRLQTSPDVASRISVQLDGCQDLATLRLSGNRLHSLSSGASFLNMQRLELASTGLESLPKTFGLDMPNLRVLNLNHNAIKDIRPLLGIANLAELHVAGNRICRLRRTTTVLRKLGKAVESIDCRVNPLTIGFYTSPVAPRRTDQQIVATRYGDHDRDDDDNAEDKTAAVYVVPPGDETSDQQHRETIDEDTALRRRVYEMLVLGGCSRLGRLDGLRVQRGLVEKRDVIWKRLLELGVLKEKEAASRMKMG